MQDTKTLTGYRGMTQSWASQVGTLLSAKEEELIRSRTFCPHSLSLHAVDVPTNVEFHAGYTI